MITTRKISRVIGGKPETDGAGVNLSRVLGHQTTGDFDPFLLLDALDSRNPDDYIRGFPMHPHRGIETITYLLSGVLEHEDSLGNKGSILDGDCQWMTAGSGIIHQEMPRESEHLLGVQVWLNMPSAEKMTDPAYGDIRKNDIPVVSSDGSRTHILAGEYEGVKGAFEGRHIKAVYFDVELDAGAHWTFQNEPDNTLFIYIFRGRGYFDAPGNAKEAAGNPVEGKKAVLFSEGDLFKVRSGDDGLRFILLSARPLREPIAWGGPIVMNTKEELSCAFKELKSGNFIKS